MKPTHAIVIGGSIAGLLAARVLSDFADDVTIIERDRLPHKGDYRAGAPQARHLHTLLIRGEQVLNRLFPGFERDLEGAGALLARWGLDNSFYTTGGWTPHFDSGYRSHILGRAELEWLVRQRVGQIANIHFVTETDMLGLIPSDDGQSIIGVRTESRVDHGHHNLYAELVVDASGRNSKAPEWLTAIGFPAPAETVINAHCGYATRWYERPADMPNHVIAIQARPSEGLMRGGGLMPVEGNQVVVTLIGGAEDYPPTDEAGFLEYARTLANPAIYDIIKDLKPVSPITGYRRLENRRRHYERVAHRPENFIVMGDAAAALNPVYGQGMTKAALEAEALGQMLNGRDLRQLRGFAGRFQKRSAAILEDAWMMATGEDMRFPGVEGQKPGLVNRIGHAYFDQVARAMPYSAAITKDFFEAMTMLRSGKSMLRPTMAARVFWHTWVTRRTRRDAHLSSGEWTTVGAS